MADEELNTGLLLFIPYRWMENHIIAALAKAGFDDVTTAQMKVFQRIGPNGTRLTDLAEQAQVTKQTASFLVEQLEKAGWIERVPDPTDKRARLVRVAPRGQAAIEVSAVALAEVETQWREHLGVDRMTQLRAILGDLRRLTDPYR